MKKIGLLILATVSYTSQLIAQNTDAPLLVKTQNGLLQGVTEANGVRSFKGVPFAQPPLGNLRWAPPSPPKNWDGIRQANKFGPQAMQRPIYSDMMFRSDGKSEDCLYLNIWTPAKATKQKLPVLVYFYGGGFAAGDGSEYRYDGASMARKGIIAITVNYRLGVFGFMAHPELTKESPHHASGNYGLMDQHAALQWVQQNITAFGGDPKRVTIGGESAGSMSVSAQVASPLSKGLFAGAIAESGAVLGNLSPAPLAVAEQNGVKFAAMAGAANLDQLRKIPADKLLELSASMRFGTSIDGYFLPEAPVAIFAAGKQMHVPLLAGWNTSEGNAKAVLGTEEATIAGYKSAVDRIYAGQANDILKVYAPADDSEVARVATDLASDRFIAFATWKFTDMQSKTSGKPVYRYLYARKRPAKVDGQINYALGASHSSEIEYALGNLLTNKVYAWDADDYKISAIMQTYFANFIKNGNPNGSGLPQWPALNANKPELMLIDVNSHAQSAGHENRYALLDSFYQQ